MSVSTFSSLLIVYEGADDNIHTPMDSMEACCSLENCCVDSDDLAKLAAAASTNANRGVDGIECQESKETCCYDADGSHDSADVQLSSSHEDHAIESHLRSRRRQQKQQQQQQLLNNDCRRVVSESGKAFIPFSEETMFCDSNDMAPTHAVPTQSAVDGTVDTASPVSSDSWMNYSSHSSDDYSYLMDSNRSVAGHGRSARGSIGADGSGKGEREIVENSSKNKRNRESFKFRKEESVDEEDSSNVVPSVHHHDTTTTDEGETSCDHEEDDGEEDNSDHDDLEDEDNESVDETLAHLQINQPKRLRGKEPENTGSATVPLAISGRGTGSGGKSVNSSRRSSTNSQQLVDIRIIDFAHTAFVKKNATGSASAMPPPVKSETQATTNVAVHKGPDCGFLTGVDSLKRLLQEILPNDVDASNLVMME